MKKRQVLINALMSVTQILVISAILFILYRFLLKTIGVEALGLWSLVLATTSVTQIANLGLSGSVVKFVAKYIAHGDSKNVSDVIQTAVLSVALCVGIILIIGYPVAKLLLELVVPDESLNAAINILPHAFVALWFLMITSIFQAGLDGYQRIDLRSFLLMGGAVFHLVLCFILAPKYGLEGVAYARVIQNFTILICSWFVLRRYLKLLPLIPFIWDKALFKEIISYGMNFQVISVTTMLYDPITKGLMAKFGGLTMVGFYEMANKLVQQFRALIVSANQVLVPAIADLHENTPEKIKSVYLTSYQLLFYLSLPLFTMIILCTPLVSELWIGHYENTFVFFTTLLAIGWFFNTLAAPAYFSNLGIGELSWNVISHISIGILNAVGGLLLGMLYGGFGVVIAYVCSLILGSSIIYLSYHIRNRIPLIELLPQASRMIVITCLASILITRIIPPYNFNFQSFGLNNVMVILFSMMIIITLWIHPMKKRLIEWITTELKYNNLIN